MTAAVVVAVVVLVIAVLYVRDQFRHPEYWGVPGPPDDRPPVVIIELGSTTVTNHIHHHDDRELIAGEVVDPGALPTTGRPAVRRLNPPA